MNKTLKNILTIFIAIGITTLGFDSYESMIVTCGVWGFRQIFDLIMVATIVFYPVCKYWYYRIANYLGWVENEG